MRRSNARWRPSLTIGKREEGPTISTIHGAAVSYKLTPQMSLRLIVRKERPTVHPRNLLWRLAGIRYAVKKICRASQMVAHNIY